MVRELAELADQQVAVLGGVRGTMVQPEQLSAADYRRDGHHRDPAGDPDLLNLTRPDIVPRARRHHRRPGRLAVATGIAERNGYAKTFIVSACRKSHDEHGSIVACNHEP
jgi:5-methyltetrahydrofolate--homocysteine methyltransferase